MRTFFLSFFILTVLVPVSAFAACPASPVLPPTTFAEVTCLFTSFANTMLPLVVAGSLLVFFWGLIRMLRGTGDEAAIKAGKTLMIWGIIALFVMVSFVGILNLISADFFGAEIGIPQLPEGSSSTP